MQSSGRCAGYCARWPALAFGFLCRRPATGHVVPFPAGANRASRLPARRICARTNLGRGPSGRPIVCRSCKSVSKLEFQHLAARPLAALLTLRTIEAAHRDYFAALVPRLGEQLDAAKSALAWGHCHGDCHGFNARITESGSLGRAAAFFDFDDGGPGWLDTIWRFISGTRRSIPPP
ncbi:phosphotransferase [Mesorhizobium sp. AaZ16]|uniref:phosphotransferase n=1 Tax=Mesorhizobium sp. AaZ16 TaxID=3402289 RepID=UPI00374FA57B